MDQLVWRGEIIVLRSTLFLLVLCEYSAMREKGSRQCLSKLLGFCLFMISFNLFIM